MRLAVFVNQFPGRTSTFFARDMRGLLASGVQVDIFPIYPLDPKLWSCISDILNEDVLPRKRIHHIRLGQGLRSVKLWRLRDLPTFWHDSIAIGGSALKYGPATLLKNIYTFLMAWTWSQQFPSKYNHILAYWGNYTATGAYIYHRLRAQQVPFSIFLHAGTDLYRSSVYLRQKLLYADNIITCSEFNRQFIRNRFPDISHLVLKKIFVHHHGLDFSELPYGFDGRPLRRLIAVGRLDINKGFDYLLRAMRELISRGIDTELELVGNGQQRSHLVALAKKLHIENRVIFRGWLTFSEVQIAMRQATIFIHPSPHLGDGVPNVIKEAMAVGTPVIASDIAGIPEVLDRGRHGILVPPKDVNALVTAIERLLADKHLRQHYAQAARSYAEEKFDLWRNGRRLADLLCSTRRLTPVRSHG
jgi:colanic acid/amylovoran biosynthesis glycosyltransferase